MTRTIDLICDLDIEQSFDSFHAHAIPDGVDIGPGDRILVHDAPADIAFGAHYIGARRATLFRAAPARRLWTRISSLFELTELFEVGFQPFDQKG